MNAHAHDDPRLVAAAERQMKTWAHFHEIEERTTRSTHDARSPAPVAISYIAISREAGADGSRVARLVAERLGWDIYDKNLLDRIAERFGESRLMLDLVDETPSNWVFDVLGTWMDRKIVPHEKYVAHLSRVIQAISRLGKAVFVGRAAQFLLPRRKTLAVRIVASDSYRLEQIVRLQNLSIGDARVFMEETDRGRREFIERFFHHDINDPRLYDLVINVERCGLAGAADQIILASCRGAVPAPEPELVTAS